MLRRQAEANVPTDFGKFSILAYSEKPDDWMPHLALISEGTDLSKTVNVRIHSECITGEVFHSRKCECGPQLDAAIKFIHENGGVIIYLRQEGRNIGIINKLKAYALQEKGFDTVQANVELGLLPDARDFGIAVEILNDLGVTSINLLTNNPEKLRFIEESSIELKSRIPLIIEPNEDDANYLEVKKNYFGHFFGNL